MTAWRTKSSSRVVLILSRYPVPQSARPRSIRVGMEKEAKRREEMARMTGANSKIMSDSWRLLVSDIIILIISLSQFCYTKISFLK